MARRGRLGQIGWCALLLSLRAGAQDHSAHAHHHPPPEGAAPVETSSEHLRMMRAMVGPLDLSLQRFASGTAWQPATTPMFGHMALWDEWSFMLHYLVFGGLNVQGSARGGAEGFSTNWVMGMAQGPLLGGRFTARAMLSLEAPLLGTNGYRLLMQTGETSSGQPLVDRQHPHDLLMEVAVKYNRELTSWLAFEIYLAPAGEPALGPPGFPHRLSSYGDPFAPLSHHWQDSTHISFGVLTAGLYTRFVKIEGSWFNGREPDENRYNLDLRVPDSYSVRVAVNPAANWSGQVSYGFLKEPEALEPGESVHRITASVTYNRRFARGNWASTLVWGQNRSEHTGASNSFLAESNLLLGHDTLFGRAEVVTKSRHDFALLGPAGEGKYTGELQRAVELFERFVSWGLESLPELGKLRFFLGVLALWKRIHLERPGEIGLRFPSSFPLTSKDGRYSSESLLRWARQQAGTLAHAFDVRNGNTYYAGLMAAVEAGETRAT